MRNSKGIKKIQLAEIIKEGSWLPEKIFNFNFRNYYFFDADIWTSTDVLRELEIILKNFFGSKSDAIAYSSIDKEYLGFFDKKNDFLHEIPTLSTRLKGEDNYTGLILIGSEADWVLYQDIPGEMGVLALNSPADINVPHLKNLKCFLKLEDVERNINASEGDDVNEQVYFFELLLKNYAN